MNTSKQITSIDGVRLPTGYAISRETETEANALDENGRVFAVCHGENALNQAAIAVFRESLRRGVASLATLQRKEPLSSPDLGSLRGNEHVKRALEVAASGGHSLLVSGSRGSGKWSLASAMPTLVPERGRPLLITALDTDAVEVAALLQAQTEGLVLVEHLERFSEAALMQLAHTLEHRKTVQIVATIEPCPCGYYNDDLRECICDMPQIEQYVRRLSGIIELFAIHCVTAYPREQLRAGRIPAESSADVKARVTAARARQRARYQQEGMTNAVTTITWESIAHLSLDETAQKLMNAAIAQIHPGLGSLLSLHAVARTCADLAGEAEVHTNHVAEAVQYRSRRGW